MSIQPILACDRIGVSFVDDDGGRLVAHYARTGYEPVLLKKGCAEDLAGSSLERVIASGTPRIINDLERYAAKRPDSRSTAILLREGVQSSLPCPLAVEGRNVGVIFFSDRRPSAYRDHDIRLQLAIAERLSQAVEKAWRIERTVPDGPLRVTCDPDLLRIVAVNLVSNAVKYGRAAGTVRVTVERRANGVTLRVWNDGPGLPAHQRSRLFRKLSRLDTPELRAQKGTGVGLYTSWRIVQLHGGRMSADSRDGEWAEFRVDLPGGPAPR